MCVCVFCVKKNVAVNTTKVFLRGGGGGEMAKIGHISRKKNKITIFRSYIPVCPEPKFG